MSRAPHQVLRRPRRPELSFKGVAGHPFSRVGGFALAQPDNNGRSIRTDVPSATEAGSYEQLQTLVASALDGIITINAEGVVQQVNPAAAEMFGHDADVLVGERVEVLMPPAEAEAHAGYIKRYLATGKKSVINLRRKVEGRRADGTHFPLELTVAETGDKDGRRFTAFLRDLSRLEAHEQRFQTLVDALPDGVVIHRQGRIVYANRALVTMLGRVEQEELIDQHVLDVLVHADDREKVAARIADETHETRWPITTLRALRKDGSTCQLEATAIRVEFQSVPSNVVVLRDVGEREELRRRMIHTERMASVGTLAAGIGHEINNPLTYIVGNLEFALTELQEIAGTSPSVRVQQLIEALTEARTGAERARRIVGDLAAFSRRRDADEVVPIDVNAALEISLNMTRTELRHRARVRRDFGCIGLVLADETSLVQVFVNLLTNAAHAIEPGAADDNEICVSSRKEGAEVVVEVRDTGKGIPKSQLDRVFDPFFTTKPQGVGTGLGLSISYGIIDRLGGRLSLESREGEGTVATVSIPVSDVGPESVPSIYSDTRARDRKGHGRILLVDDDRVVAKAIRRMLDGYAVEIAKSGPAALQLVENELFDVVICDMMMPEMTGAQFHNLLAKQNPGLAERTIFITGGALVAELQSFLQKVDCPTLQKPFDSRSLRAVVRGLVATCRD